jgi:hypothetical protein
VRIHLATEGLDIESLHGDDLRGSNASTVQQTHEPANSEERQQETAKAIQAVAHPGAIGPFCHQAEHDAREESKQERNLKVIEAKIHVTD